MGIYSFFKIGFEFFFEAKEQAHFLYGFEGDSLIDIGLLKQIPDNTQIHKLFLIQRKRRICVQQRIIQPLLKHHIFLPHKDIRYI